MNTHPEKWYIPLTPENYDEVKSWWLKQVEKNEWGGRHLHDSYTVLSKHPWDGSFYWSDGGPKFKKAFPSYQEITLEQFRAITNPKPMSTLPTKWLIEVTEENQKELEDWRQQVATEYRERTLHVGYTLLSKHSRDNSCYHTGYAKAVRSIEDYNDYQEITLEQFRAITNSKPMPKPEVKTIQISRTLLNEYFDAATTPQREYLTEHFKLDGTTTDEAIRGLHDLACSTWKPKIKANHPDCFPEESKYFDFSKYVSQSRTRYIVEDDVADSLGMNRGFIRVRSNSSTTKNKTTHDRSFYLDTDYNWELVQDGEESGTPVMVLIPTKK